MRTGVVNFYHFERSLCMKWLLPSIRTCCHRPPLFCDAIRFHKTWLARVGRAFELVQIRANSIQLEPSGWPNDTQRGPSSKLGSSWLELGEPFGQGFDVFLALFDNTKFIFDLDRARTTFIEDSTPIDGKVHLLGCWYRAVLGFTRYMMRYSRGNIPLFDYLHTKCCLDVMLKIYTTKRDPELSNWNE